MRGHVVELDPVAGEKDVPGLFIPACTSTCKNQLFCSQTANERVQVGGRCSRRGVLGSNLFQDARKLLVIKAKCFRSTLPVEAGKQRVQSRGNLDDGLSRASHVKRYP